MKRPRCWESWSDVGIDDIGRSPCLRKHSRLTMPALPTDRTGHHHPFRVPPSRCRYLWPSTVLESVALTLSFLLLLNNLNLSETLSTDDPIVSTHKGMVRGKVIDANGKHVHAYFGIPYARPPLGDLRFRQPVPSDPWEGVRDATQLPNSCYQTFDYLFGNFSGSNMWNANTQLSEDCLYLNVWVPRVKPPYKHKAVIVWIYGGGFYSGSSTLDIYMAHHLAAENDVIVVSMQYRVGSFGFLALDTIEAQGNAGMLDQRMALQWVNTNIASFGGSPYNITLMGESAGAVSVGLFLLSPICEGLFNRAILQSGSPTAEWGVISKEEAWSRSLSFAKYFGCKDDSDHGAIVKCLRKIDAKLFPDKEYYVVQGICQFPFVPIVDGYFMPEEPREILRKGNFKNVPLLLGSNSNEATFFLIYIDTVFNRSNNIQLNYNKYFRLTKTLFDFYPRHPKRNNAFGLEAIGFQYRNWTHPDDGNELRISVDKAVSDYHFVCKVNHVATAFAKKGIPVFYYWFDQRWTENPWPQWMGVLHADEIWFTFGHPLNDSHKFSQEEIELSKKMMSYWTNFAKTGNPNQSPGEAINWEWPPFEAEQNYMLLSVEAMTTGDYVRSYPRTEACAFWEEYLPSLVARTLDISQAELEWKEEFNIWKTRYIVDWKTQFDNFIRTYQDRMGSCVGGGGDHP